MTLLTNFRVHSYNQQNQVTGFKDALGNVTSYSYDTKTNLTQVSMPSGRTVNFTYDTANRINEFERSDGTTVSYSRNNMGSPLTVTLKKDGSTVLRREYEYNNDESVSLG